MLSFKALVAKSRELTTMVELSAAGSGGLPAAAPVSAASAAPPIPSTPDEIRSEGSEFLRVKQAQMGRVLARHHALVDSGDELAAALATTRSRLLDEAESAQFLAQSFHLVGRVRQQLGHLRGLVEKIAEDVEDVENLLSQRTEEYMAKQNAEFAARQQEELERFEEQILHEKEGRKRALLEERRQKLAQAFHNDLRTYQTLVTYQGATAASALAESTEAVADAKETLESIDLVVVADADQLDAFYDSDSASETAVTPRFSAPDSAVPQAEEKPAVDTADDVDPSVVPGADGEEEEEKEEEDKEVSSVSETTEDDGKAAPAPNDSATTNKQVEDADASATQ